MTDLQQFDGTKRPPPLSPEERVKRADGRDRGVLNDGDVHIPNAWCDGGPDCPGVARTDEEVRDGG